MRKVPQVMTCEGSVLLHVPAFNTWLTAKFFLNRRRSDTLGLPSSRRIRNESPRELVRPRYRLPESEGGRVLGDLLRATSCGDEQPLTSRTMCSGTVHTGHKSPTAICAHIWQGRYRKSPKCSQTSQQQIFVKSPTFGGDAGESPHVKVQRVDAVVEPVEVGLLQQPVPQRKHHWWLGQ